MLQSQPSHPTKRAFCGAVSRLAYRHGAGVRRPRRAFGIRPGVAFPLTGGVASIHDPSVEPRAGAIDFAVSNYPFSLLP